MKIRIGRVEIAFAVFLAVYFLASWLKLPGADLLWLAVAVLFVWVCVRLSRGMVRQLLWRLRNRLAVAYFFIAVVPILLITALAVLGGTLLGGQLSVHLVTAELDRRVASLRSSLEFLARRDELQSDWQKTFGPFQQSRFPGIQIAVTNGHRSVFPAESELSSPPLGDKDSSGLLLKNRLLYGWAQAVHKDRKVTAIFPITREYLGVLYPDLADTGVVHITDGRPNVLHLTPPDWKEPSRNRLPPQANFFDREIWWGVVLPVTIWENPGLADQNVFLHVRTRPSAVLRIVLAQKVDFAYDLILILFFGVAILFLIAEIIALAIGISLTRSITGAVHDLYEGTARVTGGDFSHRIPIQGKDQLGELSLAFNGMTGNMQRLLEGEKERERLQAELEIAREVQNQLYPRHVPDFPSLCLTAVCNPARMVSGDYYDYQLIEKDKVAIVMGDVAGKGISAALLMATVQSSFRTQLRVSLEVFTPVNQVAKMTVSTSKVVSCLNQQLFADTAPEKYATFYLGVYDALTSELTYTNAGHLPPILIHNGETTRLDVNGMVVGAFQAARYDESRVTLTPGDLMVFFTDGITEPENDYGEMFGEDRLADLALQNVQCKDTEIVDSIMKAVRQWTGSDELQDDMTLLLVRRL